ncbi:unnamed protein product, partial [Mesorhabditis belari]|uniref:F-box domain-containing protein n=1 Tax=Mesorhabditis belari TaxID=2138241 RepID=A0AAF3J702_9BILA
MLPGEIVVQILPEEIVVQSLPGEIVVQILQYLPHRDRRRFCLTNKRFDNLYENLDSLNKGIYSKITTENHEIICEGKNGRYEKAEELSNQSIFIKTLSNMTPAFTISKLIKAFAKKNIHIEKLILTFEFEKYKEMNWVQLALRKFRAYSVNLWLSDDSYHNLTMPSECRDLCLNVELNKLNDFSTLSSQWLKHKVQVDLRKAKNFNTLQVLFWKSKRVMAKEKVKFGIALDYLKRQKQSEQVVSELLRKCFPNFIETQTGGKRRVLAWTNNIHIILPRTLKSEFPVCCEELPESFFG